MGGTKTKPRRKKTRRALPLVIFSERQRRREAKVARRWPNADVTDLLKRAIADAIGRVLGSWMDASILARKLDEHLGRSPPALVPNPSGPQHEFMTYLDEPRTLPNPAVVAYDYLGLHPHCDVVEAAIASCPISPETRGRAALATEINNLWRAHGFAFQLRRVPDGHWYAFSWRSEALDEDLVDAAFTLLANPGFEGPLREYESGLRELGKKDRTAATDTYAAFESTMKSVWAAREPGADIHQRPGRLIQQMREFGLIDDVEEQSLVALVSIASREGLRHGGGPVHAPVSRTTADLVVHLAGTVIVMLIRRHGEIPMSAGGVTA